MIHLSLVSVQESLILLFIVLEYLVPSTGKLYHHKMKLRHLKPDSDTNEMLEYLKKETSIVLLDR